MQTDMLIFQDINNGFPEVVEDGKSIKALEKTDNLAEEEGGGAAFAGFLNEQINTVLEGRTSLKQHDENIKSLDEEDIQDEGSNSEINKKKTCEGCFIFSVSGFSNLETPVTDKSETIDLYENKTEFADKIESVKFFESVDINDSKTGVLIAQPDVEDTDLAIKNNGVQADRIKLDKTGTDASEKANIKSINNPPELLHLKNGYEISPGEEVLSEKNNGVQADRIKLDKTGTDASEKANIKNITNSPEVLHLNNGYEISSRGKVLSETSRQSQAEAGIDVAKKDIADQDQSIKKHDQISLQKKETPFTGLDERFDDKSGSREGFNKKAFLGKLESKAAPVQNGFNKAPLQAQEGAGVNYASDVVPKIVEQVFTQMQDLKDKDSNISKIQVVGENKETGHIFLKSHFPEQPAGAVKGDEPAQKPAATEVLSQVIDKAVLTLRKGQNEMRISLKPDSLGHLNLKIVTDNHHVMVKIMADTPYVKELIENNLHHLKGELSNHGLEIDRFDVLVAEDSYRNGGREGNNEFFKMKNRKNADRDSEDKVADEPEAPAAIMKKERGTSLVGVFA
ncbi:MAG: flagellar hook-length control protein FliK [Deltaproteobacteria bacterium]|nr:flagellar hook-length control protein FliK [Deltaproteobacteria bacterium]